MKIIVVSHPSRAAHVEKLCKHLAVLTIVINTISARSGHLMALKLAQQHDERVAIMEDDAIPVENFDSLSDLWALAHPDDMLSFYLGTSRPVEFQRIVDNRITLAESFGDTAIRIPKLLHAVCYSIPPKYLHAVVTYMGAGSRIPEADFAIGAAWGREVVYPIESLVQHRDETPVERHPDGARRSQPRVARRLAGPLMYQP